MNRTQRDMRSRASFARVLAAVATLCWTQIVAAGETITFLHNDLIGSPVMATDVNGLQAWKETYRPYGDQLIDAAANQNNKLWFAGKPFDDSTGLSYMKARYYDPTLGRFMGVDPMSFSLENLHSFNRYAYANNNPFRFVDPNGEWAISFNIGIYGYSFGSDKGSGQFFTSHRWAMTGLGIVIDPFKNAPSSKEGQMERPCKCEPYKVSWEKGNIEAGVVVGPLSWQPVKYEGVTTVAEHIGQENPHYYNIQGEGLTFDLLNFESVFDGGKFGWDLDLEANYEFGSTIPWNEVRSLFGMDPLPSTPERPQPHTSGGR